MSTIYGIDIRSLPGLGFVAGNGAVREVLESIPIDVVAKLARQAVATRARC